MDAVPEPAAPEFQKNEDKPVKQKNRPGRPKKEPEMPQSEFYGITDAPSKPGIVMELVYRHPIMFKKLFHLFKTYHVSEITMVFTREKISITAVDHNKKSTIYTHIHGCCMNLYYCAMGFTISVKRDNMEKILRMLNKNHFKISLISREENYRSFIYMGITTTEYHNDNSYEIPVIYKEGAGVDATVHSAALYPIKFHMDAKNFKFNVSSIAAFSKIFTVQRTPDKPLELSHQQSTGVKYVSHLSDVEKLGVTCTLPANAIFMASVDILQVRPISQNIFGPLVYIAADIEKPMSFMMMSEDKIGDVYACVIEIFTNLMTAGPPLKAI